MTREAQQPTIDAVRQRVKRVTNRQQALAFIESHEHWLEECRNANNRQLIMTIAIAILRFSNQYPGVYQEALADDQGITLLNGNLQQVRQMLEIKDN